MSNLHEFPHLELIKRNGCTPPNLRLGWREWTTGFPPAELVTLLGTNRFPEDQTTTLFCSQLFLCLPATSRLQFTLLARHPLMVPVLSKHSIRTDRRGEWSCPHPLCLACACAHMRTPWANEQTQTTTNFPANKCQCVFLYIQLCIEIFYMHVCTIKEHESCKAYVWKFYSIFT